MARTIGEVRVPAHMQARVLEAVLGDLAYVDDLEAELPSSVMQFGLPGADNWELEPEPNSSALDALRELLK